MGIQEKRKPAGRSRIKYRPDQLETLEDAFCEQQYPDSESIETLAEKVGVTSERVAIWFQNRRARYKRESKEEQMNWMRKQLYTNSLNSTGNSTSLPSSHVLTPPEVDSRLQIPSKNIHYLPNTCTYLKPFDDGSDTSGSASSTPSPPLPNNSLQPAMYGRQTIYGGHGLPQMSTASFSPRYASDYQQPFYRYFQPGPQHHHYIPNYTLHSMSYPMDYQLANL